jgi:hypothetical protein
MKEEVEYRRRAKKPETKRKPEKSGKEARPARNESTAPPVALVGKQSPYNPGEM